MVQDGRGKVAAPTDAKRKRIFSGSSCASVSRLGQTIRDNDPLPMTQLTKQRPNDTALDTPPAMIRAPCPDAAMVSVIVPIYNVAGHVRACIESLRAQTLRNFDVLMVDDGSTDGSGDVALAAAAAALATSTRRASAATAAASVSAA